MDNQETQNHSELAELKKKEKEGDAAAPESASPSSSKKLMILYVLEVLKRYSDEQHKLTQSEIITLIKQDYDMDCERKAISRHIRSLIDHGYHIDTYENNGEGYYITDKDFTADDVFMLWEGLMASKYISKEEATHLIETLNKFVGNNYRLGTAFYGGIINKYTYPETFIYANLMFLLTEMAMGKKVSLQYNQYNLDKSIVPIYDEPLMVSPYAVLNVDNEYYLAACPEGQREMQCFKVGLISSLEHSEFMAEDIKEIAGYSRGFDPKKFTADFIEGYGGEITDFIVLIKEDKLEIAMLDITTNFDKMYAWSVKNAEFTEVLEPAAMRFKLKEFFDVQCWKYR